MQTIIILVAVVIILLLSFAICWMALAYDRISKMYNLKLYEQQKANELLLKQNTELNKTVQLQGRILQEKDKQE